MPFIRRGSVGKWNLNLGMELAGWTQWGEPGAAVLRKRGHPSLSQLPAQWEAPGPLALRQPPHWLPAQLVLGSRVPGLTVP